MPTPNTPDAASLLALLRRPDARVPGTRLWVAFSGGRDSTVLLHWLAQLRGALAPWILRAVHVDHGLQGAAGLWREHCQRTCDEWGVPLTAVQVDASPHSGEAPEAAARRARYGACRALLAPGDVLLTAHHLRDQAETVLLRVLRGCGPDGLAGIPERTPFGDGVLLRPLLTWPRASVAAYAQAHGLRWVEDPSNAADRFDRNFIRHAAWPLLEQRWPGAESTLARLAGVASEQRRATASLADYWLQQQGAESSLPVAALRALVAPARALVVRRWLMRAGLRPPSAARLRSGLDALLGASCQRVPSMVWGQHSLRRYRERLYLTAALLPAVPAAPVSWHAAGPPLRFAGLGVLSGERVLGGGVGERSLGGESGWQVRFRQGGERIALAEGHQNLKSLFQARGVPPWQRSRWPLLVLDGICVAVPGLAVAHQHKAQPGEPGWALSWAVAGAEAQPET